MSTDPFALTVRPIGLDTIGENVVILSRDCIALRPERLAGFRKVEVMVNGCTIVATVLIADGLDGLQPNEIGLTQPALRRLGFRPGDQAHVALARSVASLDAVRAKIRGEELPIADFRAIVRDLAAHRYSDIETTAFLIASASFMTTDEVLSLTTAMSEAG